MFAVVCGLAGTAALAAVLTAPLALAGEGSTGSAYALSVRTALLDSPLVKVDPMPTAAYPKGADESVATVGPNLAGLVSAKVLNATSDVHGGLLTSRASLAEVVVRDVLKAKVVTAKCQAGEDGLTGRSSIAELTVLGQKIDVTAKADINVLGVATVKLNEQVKRGNTLTVNAVHVTVGGTVRGVTSADIVLSQAKCSANGTDTPTTPPGPTPTTSEPTQPEEPGPTTSTSKPDEPTTPATSSGGAQGGIEPAADTGDLAETGVSSVVPLLVGGGVLVAGGGAAFYLSRRRSAVKAPSND